MERMWKIASAARARMSRRMRALRERLVRPRRWEAVVAMRLGGKRCVESRLSGDFFCGGALCRIKSFVLAQDEPADAAPVRLELRWSGGNDTPPSEDRAPFQEGDTE
jgi:hypothetical protein